MPKQIVIYTRYSSDMQREDSCEDQEREVRQGLARLGIDGGSALVIHDQAESGTKNTRTGFEELCALIERKQVAILAVDDQSRFSRADNAFSFITDLVYVGGRFISTGEGIDTHQPGWELRVKVMELHNSTTIRELGRRVQRGQKGRVLEDGSAGDFPFGYESFYVDPNWAEATRRGPKPKKGLRVLESEAEWVRQVFSWFVGGNAIAEIARDLTRRGVDKGRKATTTGWHHQQVRRMLANPKYIGSWPWGVTTTLRNSDGKTKQVPVPVEERVVRERPDLRIIDQETWEKAQRRLRDLDELYGQELRDKPRGPKPHHTEIYPKNLLGGLLFCHLCQSRLWIQGSGGRAYLGCPRHKKGMCGMANRVPTQRAEQCVLGFVAEVLTAWPGWLEAAAAAMRRTVVEIAQQLPKSLRAAEERLVQIEKRIDNIVDQLADGNPDSSALRLRLSKEEAEADALRRSVADGKKAQEAAIAMPEDAEIRTQLTELKTLLADDPRRSAPLLRRLLGRVTAEAIIAPGKKRGFIRLHLRLKPERLLREVLHGQLPGIVISDVDPNGDGPTAEYHLDLGEPTHRDVIAPEIDAMRARGMTWIEIDRVTQLGIGNAYNVWKRWADAQPGRQGLG